MDDDVDGLIDRLRALSLGELVYALSRVLPGHAWEESMYDCKVVLSVLARPKNPANDPEYRFQETVAWPDYDAYGADAPALEDPRLNLTQQGGCPGCGLDVVSTLKLARCPQCGAACGLT